MHGRHDRPRLRLLRRTRLPHSLADVDDREDRKRQDDQRGKNDHPVLLRHFGKEEDQDRQDRHRLLGQRRRQAHRIVLRHTRLIEDRLDQITDLRPVKVSERLLHHILKAVISHLVEDLISHP